MIKQTQKVLWSLSMDFHAKKFVVLNSRKAVHHTVAAGRLFYLNKKRFLIFLEAKIFLILHSPDMIFFFVCMRFSTFIKGVPSHPFYK